MRVFQSTLVLIFAWPFSAAVAGDDTLVRVELQPVSALRLSRLAADDPLRQVAVSMEVDTAQPNVAEGLVFIVEIFNGSDDTVILADPTEHISVMLRDESGFLCNLRTVGTMSAINTGDPEGTRAWLDERRAYVIDRPEPSTCPVGAKTVHDIGRSAAHWRVKLDPRERLWLPLRIKEVQADPEQYSETLREYRRDFRRAQDQGLALPAKPLPDRGPIPAETYKFVVSVGLIGFDSESGSATGKRLECKPITVRLGEPAAE